MARKRSRKPRAGRTTATTASVSNTCAGENSSECQPEHSPLPDLSVEYSVAQAFGARFLDLDMLKKGLESAQRCGHSALSVCEVNPSQKNQGVSSVLGLLCASCLKLTAFPTSPYSKTKQNYSVNLGLKSLLGLASYTSLVGYVDEGKRLAEALDIEPSHGSNFLVEFVEKAEAGSNIKIEEIHSLQEMEYLVKQEAEEVEEVGKGEEEEQEDEQAQRLVKQESEEVEEEDSDVLERRTSRGSKRKRDSKSNRGRTKLSRTQQHNPEVVLPDNSEVILPDNSEVILPDNSEVILPDNPEVILPDNPEVILPDNPETISPENPGTFQEEADDRYLYANAHVEVHLDSGSEDTEDRVGPECGREAEGEDFWDQNCDKEAISQPVVMETLRQIRVMYTVPPNTQVLGGSVTPWPPARPILTSPKMFIRTTCSKFGLVPGVYDYHRNNGLNSVLVVKPDQGISYEDILQFFIIGKNDSKKGALMASSQQFKDAQSKTRSTNSGTEGLRGARDVSTPPISPTSRAKKKKEISRQSGNSFKRTPLSIFADLYSVRLKRLKPYLSEKRKRDLVIEMWIKMTDKEKDIFRKAVLDNSHYSQITAGGEKMFTKEFGEIETRQSDAANKQPIQ